MKSVLSLALKKGDVPYFERHNTNGGLFKDFSLNCETKVRTQLPFADFYEARMEKSPREISQLSTGPSGH